MKKVNWLRVLVISSSAACLLYAAVTVKAARVAAAEKEAKKTEAVYQMKSIKAALTTRVVQKGGLPLNLDTLVQENFIYESRCYDPWYTQFRYVLDGKSFTLISAGPDGFFGTQDDIRIRQDAGSMREGV